MKIILAVVASVNGKVTRGNESDIYKWVSKEDSELFFGWIKENSAIIMGSGTYEVAREKIKRNPGKLRIIMTRTPEKYATEHLPDILEFTDKSPQEIVKDLETRGFSQALHVGGPTTQALFFDANLIDELYLTVEPLLFAQGKTLVDSLQNNVQLKLLCSEQLNNQGTLLLKYEVQRAK